jgi:hypothetical protein
MWLGSDHGLRYNVLMAQALEKALTAVAQLSEEEQSRLGEWILAELAAERAWNDRFTESSDMLASMAKDALGEHARGETTDLHIDDK